MIKINDTLDYYNNNELSLNYVINNEIDKTIDFKNNKFKPVKLSKKKINKDDDILDILQERDDIGYDETINIYPTDTVSDLKKKISLLFGMEWYKITIYCYGENDNYAFTSYDVVVNYKNYQVSFDNINAVDTYLYDNKDTLFVKSKDESMNLNYFILNNINTIYFIYFDDVVNKEKINSRIGIDYYYYNFIIKYFPMFTLSVFNDYVMYKDNFNSKYNGLIDINQKIMYYNDFTELINKNYKKTSKINTDLNNMFSYKNVTFTLKGIINTKTKVVIRNIFDLLHVGELGILLLYFYSNQILYTKKNKYDETTKVYKSDIDPDKLSIYIKNDYNVRPLILSVSINGDVSVQIYISDDHKTLNINDIIKYVSKDIMPIINKLNEYKELLNFNYIDKIDENTFKNVNKCTIRADINYSLKDSRFLNFNNYLKLKDTINVYNGIFSEVKKEENNDLKFYINSGVSYININKYYVLYMNKTNTYGIYTSNEDAKEWKGVYPGLNSTVSYFLENVNLNVKKIDYNDIHNISKIFNCIVDSVDVSEKKQKLEVDSDKVLKRLKNVDPVMFSFETSKNSDKKYAKICQKPFHPIIYTKDEIKDVPKDVKNRLIEFKNATTNELVYYDCPSKKAPYLGFVVNKHPNDYCIPCCRIKPQQDKDSHSICLKNYKYSDKKENLATQLYVLNNIEDNRYSKLPYNLDIIFNKSYHKKYVNTKPFYIFGINGLLNIINFCVNGNYKDLDSAIHKGRINILVFYKKGHMDISYFYNYEKYVLVYFAGLYYHPIVNNAELKIYDKNSDIIKYLTKIIDKYESINNNNFFHFNSIDKRFKIETIFVNNKNYIYGVSINNHGTHLYIPVIYHLNNTEYKVCDHISDSVINNTKEPVILQLRGKDSYIPTSQEKDNNINSSNSKRRSRTESNNLTNTTMDMIGQSIFITGLTCTSLGVVFSGDYVDTNIKLIAFENGIQELNDVIIVDTNTLKEFSFPSLIKIYVHDS